MSHEILKIIESQDIQALKQYIKDGGDVDVNLNIEKLKPLLHCLRLNLIEFVKIIYEVSNYEKCSYSYKFYLHDDIDLECCCIMFNSAILGRLDAVKYFLTKGKDPFAAFYGAYFEGWTDIMEYLVDKLPDKKIEKSFYLACKCEESTILKVFLSKNIFFEKGIIKAARYGNLENVKLLTFYGVNFKNNNGETALMVSLFYEKYDISYYLSELCDCNIQDNYGNTALNFLIKNLLTKHEDGLKMLKILLEKCDPNICDNQGNTPIFNVCKSYYNRQFIKLLLSCDKVDKNFKNNSGITISEFFRSRYPGIKID